MSPLMAADLVLELLCVRFPLVMYLLLGAVGAAVGRALVGRLVGGGGLKKALRGVAVLGAAGTILGAAILTVAPPMWRGKCGFRYCGRALGPGLFRSPFPVGTPPCQTLHMCANEYQFGPGEYRSLTTMMERLGCEPP